MILSICDKKKNIQAGPGSCAIHYCSGHLRSGARVHVFICVETQAPLFYTRFEHYVISAIIEMKFYFLFFIDVNITNHSFELCFIQFVSDSPEFTHR